MNNGIGVFVCNQLISWVEEAVIKGLKGLD
jgi:hypothetical protein